MVLMFSGCRRKAGNYEMRWNYLMNLQSIWVYYICINKWIASIDIINPKFFPRFLTPLIFLVVWSTSSQVIEITLRSIWQSTRTYSQFGTLGRRRALRLLSTPQRKMLRGPGSTTVNGETGLNQTRARERNSFTIPFRSRIYGYQWETSMLISKWYPYLC